MSTMTTLFHRIGGTAQVKTLATTFYDVLEADDSVQELRRLHAQNLISTKKKLFRFLSHYFEGPTLYTYKVSDIEYLERIHAHFAINDRMAKQWLYCLSSAMDKLNIKQTLRDDINDELSSLIKDMQDLRKVKENGTESVKKKRYVL